MLNLFVLTLVEQFEEFFDDSINPLECFIEQIDNFRTVWCKYSLLNEGQSIHKKDLAKFLLDLGEPLGAN